MERKLETQEDRDFWAIIDNATEVVTTWPDWKVKGWIERGSAEGTGGDTSP